MFAIFHKSIHALLDVEFYRALALGVVGILYNFTDQRKTTTLDKGKSCGINEGSDHIYDSETMMTTPAQPW